MKYQNGSVYAGTWSQGKRSGRGKMTEVGQWEYEGEWWRDVRHGEGVCTFANGEVCRGNWVNDRFEGAEQAGEIRKKSGFWLLKG